MSTEFDQSRLSEYRNIHDSWTWNVPEYYNFGFEVIDRWAGDRTKLALLSVNEDGSKATYQTFQELSRLSNQFANTLRNLGIGKGERVLVILHSIPQWYACMLGMFKLGVVPMPGTVLLTAKDIAYRVKRAEAVMIITDMGHAELVDEVVDDCPTIRVRMVVDGEKDGWLNFDQEMSRADFMLDPQEVEPTRWDDPLLLYFTSGTTGQPKMVLHTHCYPLGQEMASRAIMGLQPTDLHWTVSETGWAKAAWGKLFGQMIVGAAIIQREARGRFNPHYVLSIMERYGVTTFCAPPTVYRMMIQMDLKKYRLSLRHCLSAGEPINPEVIRAWKDGVGLDIYDFYGQTETVSLLGNSPAFPLKYGSVGLPTPGHDMRVVDYQGMEQPVEEEGNIALFMGGKRSPGLMKEYWKDENAMANSFHHGYYYTGDRAYRDKEGYFWFVGRDDDIIKSSGYRIGPFEVESALIEHPAVAECAVVGSPDPEGTRGTLVKAFIVLAPGFDPSEDLTKDIQNHVKTVTAPYKYPRLIEYKKELPKTISGKILRRELRDK